MNLELHYPKMATLQTVESKEGAQNVEKVDLDAPLVNGLTRDDEQFLSSFSTKQQTKIYRKVGGRNLLLNSPDCSLR